MAGAASGTSASGAKMLPCHGMQLRSRRPRPGVTDDVPALVRVLAGNSVTGAIILACLNTADTIPLRRLHPAVAGVVARVPWADMGTEVVDTVRWRAALPAAVGAKLCKLPAGGRLAPPTLAALTGITHLDLRGCGYVSSELLLRLPPSLRTLNVGGCCWLTERASFVHLTALTALDCCSTQVVDRGVAGLPASLQELNIINTRLPPDASLARLACLRVLRACGLGAGTLASLPPSLQELRDCWMLPLGGQFAHLAALYTLDVSGTNIDDASLGSMPLSLVSLNAHKCKNLTPDAVLPPLPALRLLDVSNTGIGDALVASLPAGLLELRMSCCRGVTAGATLEHVPVLQALHSFDTDLAPGVLAACRARGCAVPAAAGVLRGHQNRIWSLAVLADGRLASSDTDGEVLVWDVAAGGGEAGVVLDFDSVVDVLAALRDGRRLAVAVNEGRVDIWDVEVVPPVRTASVACSDYGVWALAVVSDGRLAAGCGDRKVWVVDADAGAVVATLSGHRDKVIAVATLPDGTLASGSEDCMVLVWDVGARTCVATLDGGRSEIHALAVLADGRLASGASDGTVRLWDVGTRTCGGVLTGHARKVSALVALPDGRLVSGSSDRTVRVWDTRPSAAAAGSHAAGTVPMAAIAQGLVTPSALVWLPDGRIACAGGEYEGAVHLLHVPPPVPYE